jgi:hypothetical protein
MKISDYVRYQKISATKTPQHVRDDKGRIKFAVNIDIDQWKNEMDEIEKKLPPQLVYNSKYDAMRYHPQKIRGVNIPQLYMKVRFNLFRT